MALTRRQFLTLMGGSAATAVIFQACGVPEHETLVQSSIEMPEDLVTGLDNRYATLCRQCPTSEGIVVRVMEGRAKKIEGNVDYPINLGRHSVRCEAALQALYHPDRISAPLVRTGERGAGEWDEISWTDAIARLSHQLQELKQDPSAMVMVTDPVGAHLGLVVERFVSKYGGRHLPYEPLERTGLRAAMKRVFDQDVMPDFDIGNARYLLSFGADFLNTWVSPVRYAGGYGEFRQGGAERGKMVHFDSRLSMTAANADEWVYVKPGWEGVLALSIAQVIVSDGDGDPQAVASLTDNGAVDLSPFAPDRVATQISDAVPAAEMAADIRRIAHDFAHNGPSLAIGGGSAAAHTNGSFNMAAIFSLNHLVGNVGKPGGVIFNPVPALGDVPMTPASSSFAATRDLVREMSGGSVRALLVRGADPAYGLPQAAGFREASYKVPFIASFSGRMDDTTALADLVLPEHDSLEDWGSDVPDPAPGFQTLGFQQPVVRPLFESRGVHLGTKGFADILLTAAQVLGIDLGLQGDSFQDILKDAAKQLFEDGRGSVGLDRTSQVPDFDRFWNAALQHGFWRDEAARGERPTAAPSSLPREAVPPDFGPDAGAYPFHLVPFASTSLTDGRGADLPWLQATPDPITTATWQTWIEINHKKAEELGISEGDVIRVVSPDGAIEALAYPHPGASPDVVSVPIGQGHQGGGRYSKDRGANVLSILAPRTDEETGALAWASTRVRLEKTGSWVRLPRFENSAPDRAVDEDQRVIKLTPHDT